MITRLAMTSLVSLPLILGGCVIGSAEYGCPGMPEGVVCASAHDVYEMTGRGETTPGSKSRKSKPDTVSPPTQTAYLPEMSGGVIPLRTPARVMRIWINAWEGKNSDLQVFGLVYTEIEPRRWQIGLPAPRQPTELILLEPRPSATAAPSKPATGSTPPPAAKKATSLPPSKSVTGDH